MIARFFGNFRASQYFFLSGILVSTSINLLTSLLVGGVDASRIVDLYLSSASFLVSSVAMAAIGGIVEEASERAAAIVHTPLSRSEKLGLIATEMRTRQSAARLWTSTLVLSLIIAIYSLTPGFSHSKAATKDASAAKVSGQ